MDLGEDVNLIACYKSSMYLKNMIFRLNIFKSYQLLRFKRAYVDFYNVIFDSNEAAGIYGITIPNLVHF